MKMVIWPKNKVETPEINYNFTIPYETYLGTFNQYLKYFTATKCLIIIVISLANNSPKNVCEFEAHNVLALPVKSQFTWN